MCLASEARYLASEKTCGDDVVPELACGALVQLRATSAIPRLRGLLRQARFADHAEVIERAISEL